LTFNAAGTYLENNDGTYQFTNRYSSDSWWKRDRTWAPGTGTGAGTEVLKKEYGGSYTSGITTGNGAGNLPTGTGQDQANGYPTTLLAAPAQGTTFLARSFDSQNYSGNSTTTNVYAGGEVPPSTTTLEHSAYTGVCGYRYFFSNTAKSGNRSNTSNP